MNQIRTAFVVVLTLTVVVFILYLSTGSTTKVHVISVYGSGGNLVKQYVTDSTLWTGSAYVGFKVDGKAVKVYGNFIVEEL